MNMGGASMTMNMTGTMSGTAQIHLPSGLMTLVEMEQDMTADATVDAQGGTMNMQMAITGTTTQTVEGPMLKAPATASDQ